MNGNNKPLLEMVRAILLERGYQKTCLPLDDVANRIENTHANIDFKIKLYKWSAMLLLILIPVLSTSLSILATDKLTNVVFVYMTYLLTLLTLFNSIFRPSQRFRELCEMGIALQDLEDDFLSELEDLSNGVQESSLHVLRETFHKELVVYERRLIALFLPSEAAPQPARKGRVTPPQPKARHAAAGK